MIFRKTITILKIVFWRIKGIDIKVSPYSNIYASVHAYNHGTSMKVGQVYLRSNVSLNTDGDGILTIGNSVFINRNSIVSCRYKIDIGDNCIIAPNVCIYDHDHKFSNNGVKPGYELDSVVIGKNCWIGAGAIILKGTNLGDNVIVAAGSVVKGKIPNNSIFYNKREFIVKSL